MESHNNFKELERQIQDELGTPPKEIQNNIRSNIRFFHLIGDLIDLFFPKVLSIFAILNGPTDNQNDYKDYGKPPNLVDKNQTKNNP